MAQLPPVVVKVELDLSAIENASDEALDMLADKLADRIYTRFLRRERLLGNGHH